MFQSSRDFLMHPRSKSLPYKLQENGYDVWLANARGSQYSRGHLTLNPNQLQYWLFSVDEVVKYDSTAIIDYVLTTTGSENLVWIGYSLGTAVGLGLTSSITEYNQKISSLVLLGTTAYVGHCKSPVLRVLAPFERVQTLLMSLFNHGESLPLWLLPLMRTFLPILCLPEAELNKPGFCSVFLWIVAGISVQEANPVSFLLNPAKFKFLAD
jgi:pimeloyl-ACP methyl ester carboxylesterase